MSVLVLTDNGVEEATIISRDQLDLLARWLCQKNEYCDHQPSHFDDKRTKEQLDRAYDRAEEERKANGGYCNACRDFAGEILAKFDVKERV